MRKIIHIDMDCFYAAVEMRDNPALRGKAVAVGGASDRRGVLCTCNYEARKYGVHSAMATAYAMKLCPDLIVVPTNFSTYREIAYGIREIFHEYTDLIEPLSLDEAYLDVSDCPQYRGSATWIAENIRHDIYKEYELTASAGIAPNKFLAKIASDWNKPNGQFVITPDEIDAFVTKLPVKKIFGVGKVTAKKLADMNIHTCQDLQVLPVELLDERFGKFGRRLHELSFGIDERCVEPNRIRKSLSVEETFNNDLSNVEQCLQRLDGLFEELTKRLDKISGRDIHKQFVKIKFHDFATTTIERVCSELSLELFQKLCKEGYQRKQDAVRLLGIGVRFDEHEDINDLRQQMNLEL